MRIAMLGASHWHTPMYLDAVRDLPDHQLVGLSDPQPERITERARKYGCRAYSDESELLEQEKPDFLFLFGEHARMPDLIRLALHHRLPFAVEKPAGVSAAELRLLATMAYEGNLFNAVGYVYRLCPLSRLLNRWRTEGIFRFYTSLRFRYLTGAPERYRQWNCGWMLEPPRSGGGVGINLGVHYIDLIRYLTGTEVVQAAGLASNRIYGEAVEDHSWLLLQTADGTAGIIETGYVGTGRPEDLDYFEIMTDTREMIFYGDRNILVWHSRTGENGTEFLTQQQPRSVFVKEVLRACAAGEPAPADLNAAAAALQALELAGQFHH